jgi:hypothetical protein
MATTKMGRVRKQLEFNLKAKDTNEQDKPRVRKMVTHTVHTKTRQENGEVTVSKQLTSIQIEDNTCGRNSRRKEQIKKLQEKLASKKSYSPKNEKVTEDKPKAEKKAKKGKGK